MHPASFLSAGALRCALVLSSAPFIPGLLEAQPPAAAVRDAGALDTAGLERFARAHVAIQALRDREHAELADPRRKKPEEHQEIRARFAKERTKALQAGGYTDAAFAEWTHRISASDSLRARFEALLTRLNAPK